MKHTRAHTHPCTHTAAKHRIELLSRHSSSAPVLQPLCGMSLTEVENHATTETKPLPRPRFYWNPRPASEWRVPLAPLHLLHTHQLHQHQLNPQRQLYSSNTPLRTCASVLIPERVWTQSCARMCFCFVKGPSEGSDGQVVPSP